VIKWDAPRPRPGIDRGQRTIAEALHGLEYLTGAYYASEYFDRARGRGFERDIEMYDTRRASLHERAGVPAGTIGSSARQMADDARDFFRVYSEGKWKFFLTLHFYDPHEGYEPHREAPAFGAEKVDLYDGEVWFTDHQVGRVIDGLKEHGLYDRTAIFLTASQGADLGERTDGAALHASLTKVPLIVRIPGLPPRRVKAPVGHVDLAPTLVSLARAPAQQSFLGRSLLPLMSGGAAAAPISEAVLQELRAATPAGGTVEQWGLATATHHLIWRRPEDATTCYDLATDPGERRDLWTTRAGERACPALKRELARRRALFPPVASAAPAAK
jgi:arylsulfatase A-like enzyme